MLTIEAPAWVTDRLHHDAVLKVKVEVDTDPPPDGETEMRSLLAPMPFQVRVYAPSSLFAGKVHALLCRAWKNRIKGRDFYDFVWFIGMKIPCNLQHLKARMVQTGHWKENDVLDRVALMDLLNNRFSKIDFVQAAQDVAPFVTDKRSIELWSPAFFSEIALQIKTV
jgi:hypothetical protein